MGGRDTWDGREETWPGVEIGSWGRQIEAEQAEAEEVRNTISELFGPRANLGGDEGFIYYVARFVGNSLHRPMRRNEMMHHQGWIANLDENGLLPRRRNQMMQQREWEQRESNVRQARSEGQGEQQGEEGQEEEAEADALDGGENNSGDNNEVEM